jgi:hypothetical protein
MHSVLVIVQNPKARTRPTSGPKWRWLGATYLTVKLLRQNNTSGAVEEMADRVRFDHIGQGR